MAKYVQPNFIVDSSASFLRNVTFDSSVYLQGVTHINAPAGVSSGTPYALVLESGSGTDLQVKSVQLGTMAFQTAATWDSSLSVIRTDINNLETSVGALDTLTQSHTAKLAVHDASIGVLTQKDLYIDSSLNALWANQLSQDASIVIERQKWIDSNRTGFLNQTETTLSFTPGAPSGSGTFTLNSVGASWSYYRDGIKYTISGNKSIALNGVSSAPAGRYYITIEGTDGALSVSTTPWSLDTQTVLVAYVDWDPSNTPTYAIGEERHTMLIDRQIHKYLHETQGTKFVSGGILTGPDVAAGDVTVTDASNAVGISATEIADEDLFQTLPALTRPNGTGTDYWVFTRNSGNLSDWKLESTPLPEGASYIQYDNGTTMVEATPGKYVNTYIMFTNLSSSGSNPRFAILPGQGQYDTLDAAIDENPAAFNFTGLPVAEYVIAWQLTWEASTGYTTDGKVALASAPKRIEVNATTASQVTTESHNDLIGLQGGTATERYHLTAAQWADYIGKTDVDASLLAVWQKIGYIDGSIAGLDTLTQTHTTEINNLESSVGALDSLTQTHTAQIVQLDASIVRLDDEQATQDASIVALRTRVSNHDTSIAGLDTLTQTHTTDINNLESSVGALDALTQTHTTDINNLESSVGALDTLTQGHTADIAQLEASIVRTDAYQAIQDASIALAVSGTTNAWNGLTRTDNSIGLGGTLAQDTVINTSVYQLGVLGSMQISGDLTVDGSITYINTTELDVSDNIIHINTGLAGVPPVNMVSGMRVNRGSSDPYFFIFSEADDTFRIGINASEGGLPSGTQAVATREDIPNAAAVPFWNGSQFRFDTNSGFTFAAGTGLDVDNRITANLLTLQNIPNLTGEATALVIATDGSVGYRELGTNAFSSAVYALDSSLATVRTLVNVHEASIGNIYVELGYADASTTALNALIQTNITDIANLETSVGALDTLTQSHTAKLAVHEASIGFLWSYDQIQDASIAAVGGAWKPYMDASLAARDISIAYLNTNKADITYVDGSIAALKSYTDGSLAARDTSIAWLNTNKLSLSGGTMTGLLALAAQGFSLDGVTITAIDTSAEGLGQLDTAIPTSGAVSKAIAAAIVAGVTASNGLTEVGSDIQLGGTLTQATTIDVSTSTLTLGYGDISETDAFGKIEISDSTGIRIAAQDDSAEKGVIHVQNTGRIDILTPDNDLFIDANATQITSGNGEGFVYTSDYETGFVNRSLITKKYSDDQDAIRDASIVTLRAVNAAQDASIIRIDASLNDVIDIFEVIDASFGEVWDAIDDLESSVGALDTLTQSHTAKLAVHEASIGFLWSYDQIQDASIAAAGINTKAWNGLTKTDNSIGLGGALDLAVTTITTNGATNSLRIAGLATSVSSTPYAIVSDAVGGDLKVRQLGSMAWETSTNYTLKSLFDSSIAAIWTEFGYVDTSLANIWTKFGYVDASLALFNQWNLNQDASIAAISTAQGNYVLKSGDTMTGPLTISAGGLSVANDVSISGKILVQQSLTVNNDAYIAGTLTIDGSLLVRDVETIDVSSGFIRLNTGQTGTPPATMQSGIIVERGSELPYVFVYDETLETFRIGIAPELAGPSFDDSSTQAVATRQDAPTNTGVAFWNGSAFRFDTAAGFTYASGKLSVDGSISTPSINLTGLGTSASEQTALMLVGTEVVTRELGTMAFATATDYTLKSLFDSSVAAIWTKFGHVDTSLNNLGIKNAAQDSSIAALDLLTQSHTQSITDLSTGKLDAVASTTGGAFTLYAGEANNVAYIKQLVAGSGATITQDASTVTIAVAGATSLVAKYKGTFDGTSGTSFTIAAATHSLGTGPFTVTVYENDEQVYTGVECQDDGDVVLTWSPGSLVDASCKFIITG